MQEDTGLKIQLSNSEQQLSFGDTCTAQGIKKVNLSYKNTIVSVPFTSYRQNWDTLKLRFVANYRPQQQINAEYFVELLSNKTIISGFAPLETYKIEICDKKTVHFRIYAMETKLAEELQEKLISEIAEKQSMINPDWNLERNIISVIVNKPKSQQNVIRINKHSPLQLLKLQVSKQEKLDPQQFSLMFMGKKLTNDKQTLDDRGIDDESQVDLVMLVKKGCFSKDTQVLVSEGLKKVGQIKVGDYVLSKGQQGLQNDEVTSIHKTIISEYIRIELEGGASLKCSQNHKFSSSKGWLSFQYNPNRLRLQVGDSIYGIDSNPIKILSITHINQAPSEFLHFSTLKNHNYFLNGLLCHNMQLRIISTNDGKQYMINVSDTDTIKIIKLRLQQPSGISSDQMQIVLNKHELQDNESISDYLHDYKNLNHLQLLQKVDKNVIIICRISERKQYRFEFDKKQTVRDLKKKISDLLYIDSQMLILILNNTQMLNKQLIGEFNLEKNFNRINLIEVMEEQISMSKVRFERSKILNLRIRQNSYLRLNYFPLKQMKVEHFLLSFLPDSTPVDAILFGTTILAPSSLLKEIEDLQIFNEVEINGFIVKCYDKLAFKKGLNNPLPFNPLQIGLPALKLQQLQSRKAQIEEQLKKSEYFHPMMQQFKQKMQDFYTPLQLFTTKQARIILDQYLNKFYSTPQQNTPQIKGHSYCYNLIHSLETIAAHVGQVQYLIKNIRFKGIYERGNSFYLQSFLSASIAPVSHNVSNSTLLHIQSLTGRSIGLFTNKKDEILFRPFTYFYINKLINHENYDEAWLIQVPSPQSFEKDILLWVDDEPHSKQNKQIRFLIDENRYQLVQLVSTQIAQFWMKQFGWLLKWKGKNIKVMSDMRRMEGNPPILKQEAGLDLIDSFHNNFGYTMPIFIFCSNLRKAREAFKKRKTAPSRIQKITNDEFDLISYLTS